MKTTTPTQTPRLRPALALALAALAWLPLAGFAHEKGATKLMQLKPIRITTDLRAVVPGDTQAACCPKCKDSWVTVAEKTTKAAEPVIRHHIQRHECSGCTGTIKSMIQSKRPSAAAGK